MTIIKLNTYFFKNINYGSFLIEPLLIGNGINIANIIRRILLTNITNFSITGIRINNLKHEFSNIEGLREDCLEILLNIKEIILKSNFLNLIKKNNLNLKYKGFLNVKGPLIITAGMFILPKNILKIINPNQYIGTIINSSELYIEIDIENNIGYKLSEDLEYENNNIKNLLLKPNTLYINTNFNPIKNVNYKIKLIYDSQGYIKESLHLEIITNASITPIRSFQESIKYILNLFNLLLINNNNFNNILHNISNIYFNKNIN